MRKRMIRVNLRPRLTRCTRTCIDSGRAVRESEGIAMRHVRILRRSAPARGRPGRSRARVIAQLAVAVVTLSSLALVGAHTATAAYAATGTPYGGTPAAVPGTEYAANYDTGGQGVAYNVTSTNGSANSYRSDGVDLEATTDSSPTGAAGNGYDLGWTTGGQWFKYTVNVTTAGTYALSLRLAAPGAVTDALHIDNSSGTNLSGDITAPATGGYQDWTTVTASVTLPAGVQTLTVDQDNAGWNLHYITFATSGGSGGSTPGGFPTSFWGSTSSIPSAGTGGIEFDFLNATNGQYPNSEHYW